MKSSSHACRSDNFLTLMIIYINITLYATCYQIQRPLEPYLVEQLSKDNINAAEEYGRLQSFFSLVQTFGSLFNGYLLDILSAKTGFIISFLSSALSYYIIAQSTTMNMLYISKIPTLFQAGFLCAQLSASQATKDGNERLNAFGRLTMCYTVGMVIGPTLGGSLGLTGDYYLGAKVAVAGSLLSVGLALLMPSNHDADAKIQSENPIKINEKSSLQSTISSIFSNVWLILLTKVTTSIAIAMSSSVLPLILKDTYKFNEAWMGITMSCMSVKNQLNKIYLNHLMSFSVLF
jgi:MFS family permease